MVLLQKMKYGLYVTLFPTKIVVIVIMWWLFLIIKILDKFMNIWRIVSIIRERTNKISI